MKIKMRPGHMDLRSFKGAVHKGGVIPAQTVIHKAMLVSIADAGDRRKTFTITTGAVDRDNDTISVKGWQLENYQKNPVVFWNHRSYGYPIGKTVDLEITSTALKATVEFVPADVPNGVGEEAESVWRLCDGGFVSACSVGFRPIDYEKNRDRTGDDDWWPALDFTKQELMEWSVVGIPANPEATIESGEERSLEVTNAKSPEQIAAEAETARQAIERAAEIATRRRQLRAACY